MGAGPLLFFMYPLAELPGKLVIYIFFLSQKQFLSLYKLGPQAKFETMSMN